MPVSDQPSLRVTHGRMAGSEIPDTAGAAHIKTREHHCFLIPHSSGKVHPCVPRGQPHRTPSRWAPAWILVMGHWQPYSERHTLWQSCKPAELQGRSWQGSSPSQASKTRGQDVSKELSPAAHIQPKRGIKSSVRESGFCSHVGCHRKC